MRESEDMRSLVLLSIVTLASCLGCNDRSPPRPPSPSVKPATSSAPAATGPSDTPPTAPAPTTSPDAGSGGADAPSRDDGLHSPWRADVVDVSARATKPVVVDRLEVGRHPDFDRLVIHLRGTTGPGYHIEYVDEPVRACGSGKTLPLPGDGWLTVRLQPAKAHDDAGAVTAPLPSTDGLGVVRKIARTCDFEGHVEWVLAVAAPNRYRAALLEAPLRLVVDVAHR